MPATTSPLRTRSAQRPPATPGRTRSLATEPVRTAVNALDAPTETTIEMLVGQRIRRGSIGASDREDLAQHLRIVLLEAVADYNAATAGWSTFVGVVLQRAIGKWIRHHRCACRQPSRVESLSPSWMEHGDGSACLASQATDPAIILIDRLSWADALTALLPEDRQVAELLMGHDVVEVLRLTGWSKARFYRALARIRVAFRQAGFGAP